MLIDDFKSFQVSVFDSNFQNFATKAIIPEIINDNHVIDFLIKNKESLTKFYIEFKNLIDKGENKIESYKEIFDKFPFENIIINFSKKKSILKELFKEKYYLYDLIYYFMLWHICDIYFFPNSKNKIFLSNYEMNIYKPNMELIKSMETEQSKYILCIIDDNLIAYAEKEDIKFYDLNNKCEFSSIKKAFYIDIYKIIKGFNENEIIAIDTKGIIN